MRGFKALLNNKRGSSVIMVLIAMAFISVLGTILMLSAYTGYQIKAAGAKGERAFYNAETALDEVRAGVQGIITDCIAGAYTQVLQKYEHNVEIEQEFIANFIEQFKSHALIRPVNFDFLYNGDLLESFITGEGITTSFPIEQEVEIEGTFYLLREGEVEITSSSFTLKGITITHRSADGFVSAVSSDIVVIIPDFSYVRAAYTISGIPEFALIAEERLDILADSGITGNAYGGNVSTGISSLTVSGGTLISRGDVNIDGGELIISNNADLWANKILVGENFSSVLLSGAAYIADDLVLQGRGASATLAGRYYGFGASLTDAVRSSSIIVNGLGSTLDMSGLQQLFLAGHSFINTQNSDFITNTDILTGQSVSVKSDQLAYLIPVSAISTRTNPMIFYSGSPPVYAVDYDAVLWNINGDDKRLRDYISDVIPVNRQIVGTGIQQTLLFLFMEFPNKDTANAYFRDYFSQNAFEIEGYTELYLDLYRGPQSAQTSGVYYTNWGIGEPGSDTINVSARLSDMFRNYCRSLSSSIQVSDNTTPFTYVVNEAAVTGLDDGITLFEDSDGIVRSVIINCNGSSVNYVRSILEIDDSEINLILSTGNIIVNADFEGLIISNGYIQLQSDVKAAPHDIIPSMGAKNSEGVMFGDFLNLLIIDDEYDSGGTSSWDMSALVYYENWHKR